MQSSRTPEGHQREVSRIVTALDRHHPDRLLHGGVYDPDDAAGKLLKRQTGAFCCLSHCATTRRVRSRSRVNSPPRNWSGRNRPSRRFASVTVGCSAASITDRPRIGARRFRPHPQCGARVEAGNRSPAGTHSVNIQNGDADGKARQFQPERPRGSRRPPARRRWKFLPYRRK